MRMSGEYNLDMHVDDAHVDVGGEYSLYNWFGVVFKYIFFWRLAQLRKIAMQLVQQRA